jgi:hypothetical protein
VLLLLQNLVLEKWQLVRQLVKLLRVLVPLLLELVMVQKMQLEMQLDLSVEKMLQLVLVLVLVMMLLELELEQLMNVAKYLFPSLRQMALRMNNYPMLLLLIDDLLLHQLDHLVQSYQFV